MLYTFIDMIPWLHMASTTHYSTQKEDNHPHLRLPQTNQEHLTQSSRQFVRLLGSQGFHEKKHLFQVPWLMDITVDGRHPAPVHMIHMANLPLFTGFFSTCQLVGNGISEASTVLPSKFLPKRRNLSRYDWKTRDNLKPELNLREPQHTPGAFPVNAQAPKNKGIPS